MKHSHVFLQLENLMNVSAGTRAKGKEGCDVAELFQN